MAAHERKTLVQRPQCRIELCSCGVYHVHTGAVSLRMQKAQVEAVFEALGAALTPQSVSDSDSGGKPPLH